MVLGKAQTDAHVRENLVIFVSPVNSLINGLCNLTWRTEKTANNQYLIADCLIACRPDYIILKPNN